MKKIVLTGAPSSGKSSVMKELSRLYKDKILLVPESAVVLLSGGFPAPSHEDLEQIRAFQNAIVAVQKGLEFILPRQHSSASFAIFDRGILDGAGFWPPGPKEYLKQFQIDRDSEYKKFTNVIFLELPKPEMFGGTNDHRFHNYEQSLASERQLESVWKEHPHFTKISAKETLEEKISSVVSVIQEIMTEY